MTRDEALKRAAEICTASHDLLHDHSVSSIKHAARIADALQQAAKDATLAEVENLKAQLAESRAEVEQHSHAADIWMIAESKAARERDDLKAENERLANILRDIWDCYPGYMQRGDIGKWVASGLGIKYSAAFEGKPYPTGDDELVRAHAERDAIAAKLATAVQALTRVAECTFENGEDADDLGRWCEDALEAINAEAKT